MARVGRVGGDVSAALEAARLARAENAAKRATSRVSLGGGLAIIRADAMNWALVRERVSAGGAQRDETLGYFGRLQFAAVAALELLVADDLAAERFEIGQLIAAVDRAGARVAEACAGRDET